MLQQFLESPLGKSSLITTYTQNDQYYEHPCSGNWFKQFIQECPPTSIPIALTVFFDHFEGTHNASYGAFLVGVLNLQSKVLLSPISKLCVAVIPPQLSIEHVKGILLEDLLQLQTFGLSVTNPQGDQTHYYVKVAFPSGDSKDLNNFIGFSGFNAKHGCRACWVDRDNLQNYEKKFPAKTTSQIVEIYSEVAGLQLMNEQSAAKKLLKQKSLPNVMSSFFLLRGDWCLQSPRDFLHAEILGLLKKELTLIFKEKLSPEAIGKIGSIFQNMIFPKGETNLASKLNKVGCFNGREIRTLATALPFALYNLFSPDEPWFQCFLYHCFYFQLLSQMRILKENRFIIETYIKDHHLLFKQLYPTAFTFTKEKKDGTTAVYSSPFINFHHSIHIFPDMDLWGACQYYSAEPYEHKIKHLKIVTKLTNFKNPSQDIPLADHYKNIEIWQKPYSEKISKLETFWRRNRVFDPLCPFGIKYYHWNSVTLPNSIRLEKEVFVMLSNGLALKILEIWGRKECISADSILLKVLAFSVLQPVSSFPIWEQAQPTQIEVHDITQIEKKVCGWQIDPHLYYFNKFFKL